MTVSPGPKMDLFDLRNSLAYGRSIEEVAGFLCRSGTVEEVKRKAEELGCYRPGKAASGGVLIPSLCPNLNFELF
jgi:hypothetical protein